MSAIAAMMQQFFQPSGGMPQNMPPESMPPEGPPGMPGIAAPIPSAPSGLLMPPPQAAPMPTITAPERPSLLDRVKHSLLSLGEPQDATAYRGLLSDQEIKDAKPGFMARLSSIAPGALTPGQQYQSSLDHMATVKQAVAQVVEQQRARQAHEQLSTTRAAIANRFPELPETATPQQQVQRLMGMFTAYARAGDTESASKLGEVLKSMGNVMEGPKPTAPVSLEHVDLGDRVEYVDPKTGAVIRTVKKGNTPKTPTEISAETRFTADQANKILDDYARDTKDFHQVMAGWDVLAGATKDPTLATPFAITDAYARITNPGAIVRPTTMEMIDKMGSVGQRMKKFWSHNADGQLPPDIMNDFKKTLYAIVQEHKKQYDQIREKAVLRGKRAGVDVAPLMEDYTLENPLGPRSSVAPGNSVKAKIGGIRP